MKKLSWDEYYENFFDWSLSTQKNYSYGLTDYGDAEEVYEVVSEFAFYDKAFATRFVSRALDGGVQFTPDHCLEFAFLIDTPVLSRMAETASPDFDKEQLEEIYSVIYDDVFDRICDRTGINIFDDDEDEPESDECEPEEYDMPQQPIKKPGFFGVLFAAIGIGSASDNNRKQHNGRCNGDCAHCPSHYVYRYGRWYY